MFSASPDGAGALMLGLGVLIASIILSYTLEPGTWA